MQRSEIFTTKTTTTTDTHDLDALVRRAPATDDLLTLAEWLASHGAAHLSQLERIELAERLITRRRFIIGVGGLLGAAALGACGADEQTGSDDTQQEVTSSGTRTVEHALGTTEVPVEPQRVAAIFAPTIEVALAIGIEPIVTDSISPSYPYLAERLNFDSVETVGAAELNLEAIAAADPDLIISFDVNIEEVYDELSQIAPTVAARFDSTAGWKRYGRTFAAALRGDDGAQRYDEMVAAYEQRAEEIGRRIRQARGDDFTVASLRLRQASIEFFLPNHFSGSVVFQDVGLPLPQGLRGPAEEGEGALEVSMEQLSLGDADAIFVFGAVGADASDQLDQQIEALREEPVFQNLQAVELGNVYPVGAHWFSGNIIAAPLILDDLERYLLGAGGA